MAKLPSGWIFIPRFKDLNHIELDERELVTCKECRYFVFENAECGHCKSHGLPVVPDWYCADAEAEEKKNETC